MTQLLISKKVSLTTLSPVFIGAGEEHVLSPYSDFVQRGDSLIYIDTDRLQEAMQGDEALVEAFVKGMRQFENNRSTFVLKDFITGTLGREVDDFASRVVRIEGDIQKNHIRRFIATGGKPFIPGSSLKGSIRTAVLVDWLLNKTEGQEQLDLIREYVEERDWKSLKEMNPERACFGSIAKDAFRHLRISDSGTFDRSDLSIGEMKRAPLPSGKKKEKQKKSIPQWSETVSPSSETNFSLSMTAPVKGTGFAFLDQQSIEELFAIVNRVSLESCRRELKELEGLDSFGDFYSFYSALEQDIQSLESNEAVLRVGGGKTWFDNSIGFSMDNEKVDSDGYFLCQYLCLLKIGSLPFPSTRSAIVKNGVPTHPLGWIKLSVED